MIELHVARFAELDIVTLYAILRLRCDVFIVEQDCAYSDVDGRDAEPSARHIWLTATDGVAVTESASDVTKPAPEVTKSSPAASASASASDVTSSAPAARRPTGEADGTEAADTAPGILAYLRILDDPDGTARIGRVCVARDARRAGHAATLMAAALDLIGSGRDTVLDAQAYATRLYEDAGFVRDGEEFLEDGIMHVPMRRPAH